EVLALVGEHLTNAQIASRLFISVRTVESHVSSLLRKLGAADRRALADLTPQVSSPSLPSPLTSFVGRAAERAALAELLAGHRLVTAVGPGGVGKTRLALAVAADITSRYADGARYVDLVPVTDSSMVGAAAANAFGFGEQPGRSPTGTVVSKLAGTEALVVLDNCEHLVDGVTAFVERLLAGCPGATVLATSRARLRLPFEYVFRVPGLSLADVAGEGDSDAVALFVERAAMAGWSSSYPHDRDRIAAICAELDGVALAIELAAARVATFGLDGLEAGLADPLSLLSGGSRLDARHQSVRSTLDWSFGLLDPKDQVVLRRASVFAAPFTPAEAATVAGHSPLMPGEVASAMARLADHNLLVVVPSPSSTRYRMLETIRQYGSERMSQVGEFDDVRGRHLRWCLATASELDASADTSGFDEVADDLWAGLGWAARQPEWRADAQDLAVRLARLTYARGTPSQAQDRYEEAAALAADPADAAAALHLGAVVAWGRHAGNEAIRLYRAAAEAASRAGDTRRAALELLNAAEILAYAPGILSEPAPPGADHALVAEARALGGGDAHVEAAVLVVTAVQGELLDPATLELTERAVELARRVGDARLESVGLDELTAVRLAYGELDGAAAAARRRLELLTPLADDVEMAWEYSDALHMAPMVYLAAGDLETARRYAQQRSELPFFREAHHLALEWLLTTAAMAGDFDEAVEYAAGFRRGWLEAGRRPIGGIAFAPAAAAMVYGIRGDQEARLEWLDILSEMRRVLDTERDQPGYSRVFLALVALHRGRLDDAFTPLAEAPETLRHGYDGAWRPWYAALWAELAVLAELPERHSRLDRARFVVRGNPIASAIVDRADALDNGDSDRLLAIAAALAAAGCRYQQARTLVLAGGEARAEGEAMMAGIGATPMAT
ncbi:LuxR C-terminal-related transcriptional regulator, partial [Nocardioides sp.]|uniref:LuxR C-terminal-related transcriptional regulator n=1 Tax=Nocardioides sp. TaxID=35761 RepID=UPI002ED14C91